MTVYMVWALIAFFIGAVIKRFVNPQVGDAIEVVAAVIFVIAAVVSFIR